MPSSKKKSECRVHIFYTEGSLKTHLNASLKLSVGELRKQIHTKAVQHMDTKWNTSIHTNPSSILLSADNNGSQSFGFDNDSALLEDLDPGFTSKSLLYAIVPSEVNPILSSPPTDSDCVVTPDTLSSPIYDIYKEVLKVGAKNKNLAKQAALGIEARDHDLEEKCKKMEQRIRADAKEAVQSLQDDIIEMKRRLEISEKENKALRDRVNELEANKHDVENFLTSRGLDTPVDHIIIKLRNLLDQA